jgi:exodeoxyribonuclease VII small subunit
MAKKKNAAENSQVQISFEDSLAKLEQVVCDLESGEIGLDESLKRYEEGIQHIRRCRAELERAEKRIQMLVSIDQEGRAVIEPFSESKSKLKTSSDDEDCDLDTPTLF